MLFHIILKFQRWRETLGNGLKWFWKIILRNRVTFLPQLIVWLPYSFITKLILLSLPKGLTSITRYCFVRHSQSVMLPSVPVPYFTRSLIAFVGATRYFFTNFRWATICKKIPRTLDLRPPFGGGTVYQKKTGEGKSPRFFFAHSHVVRNTPYRFPRHGTPSSSAFGRRCAVLTPPPEGVGVIK